MKQDENLTIGITGGIGAGKSVVSRILRCNGFVVYDCDYEARLIMMHNPQVKGELMERLGQDIYHSDGKLNKGKLGEEIFSNKEVRQFINGVVHKAVKTDIEKKREKVYGNFFIESAIIVTGGLAPICNRIWVVTAPLEERINRVIKRDRSNVSAVKKRIEVQEQELSLLENRRILILENDDKNLLLADVLKMTNKFNQQQTYTILC